MGLRARQRQIRQSNIIASAMTLISRNGYDETSVADIAEIAEVSPRTVYNNFGRKEQLLLAMAEAYAERWRHRAQAHIKNAPEDSAEAISGLLCAEIEESFEYADKKIWREIVVAIMPLPSDRARTFFQVVRLLSEHLLDVLKERGSISPSVDSWESGCLQHSISRDLFHDLVSVDAGSPEISSRQIITGRVRQIFRGLHANEVP